MITAVERKTVPFVLEEDRASTASEQSIFWIMPKRSHEANITLSRYGGTSKDGRQGFRDFNGQFKNGVITDTVDKIILAEVARSMSSAHLTEIFDAAGDTHKLEQGRWLGDQQPANLQEKLEK